MLAAHGDGVVTYQLQGDLGFAGVEIAIRRLVAEPKTVTHLVLDFARVTGIDIPATRMFLELLATLTAQNRNIVLVGLARHARLVRSLEEARSQQPPLRVSLFDEYDIALEWCENSLLRDQGVALAQREEIPLSKHELLENLAPDQIELLGRLMERRVYRERELVVRRGEAANELFLLVQGELMPGIAVSRPGNA